MKDWTYQIDVIETPGFFDLLILNNKKSRISNYLIVLISFRAMEVKLCKYEHVQKTSFWFLSDLFYNTFRPNNTNTSS